MNSRKRKTIFLSVVLSFVMAGSVYASGLVENGGSFQYQDSDGSIVYDEAGKIGEDVYYFGSDGNMVKNSLIQIEDSNYYFDENGKRVRCTWKKLTDPSDSEEYWFYFRESGKAFSNGWLNLNGNRYHFTDNHMDTGWYTTSEGDTYYLGGEDDGKAESGWLPYKGNALNDQDGKYEIGWYYFDPVSHKMIKDCEKLIGKNWYSFSDKGLRVDGFVQVRATLPADISEFELFTVKYYDPITGMRKDGWVYAEENESENDVLNREEGWYYLKGGVPYSAYSNTTLVSPGIGIAKIDGAFYAFDENGKMQKGLVLGDSDDPVYSGHYYYFGSDGKMKTGYVDITEGDLTGPAEMLYFDPRGMTVPRHGASVTGVAGGRIYDNGALMTAEQDLYEKVTLSDGRSFIVNGSGTMFKAGAVVKLDSGKKMKVIESGSGYDWTEVG